MSEDTLTAFDRCDKCGSQAYFRITYLESGFDLLFCLHHYNEYKTKISPDEIKILDESGKLAAVK